MTSNYQSPQRFSQGTHVITYTAVDQSGNNATCKFQVQVIGNEILNGKLAYEMHFSTSQFLSETIPIQICTENCTVYCALKNNDGFRFS